MYLLCSKAVQENASLSTGVLHVGVISFWRDGSVNNRSRDFDYLLEDIVILHAPIFFLHTNFGTGTLNDPQMT